jgi:hypothetical protein
MVEPACVHSCRLPSQLALAPAGVVPMTDVGRTAPMQTTESSPVQPRGGDRASRLLTVVGFRGVLLRAGLEDGHVGPWVTARRWRSPFLAAPSMAGGYRASISPFGVPSYRQRFDPDRALIAG